MNFPTASSSSTITTSSTTTTTATITTASTATVALSSTTSGASYNNNPTIFVNRNTLKNNCNSRHYHQRYHHRNNCNWDCRCNYSTGNTATTTTTNGYSTITKITIAAASSTNSIVIDGVEDIDSKATVFDQKSNSAAEEEEEKDKEEKEEDIKEVDNQTTKLQPNCVVQQKPQQTSPLLWHNNSSIFQQHQQFAFFPNASEKVMANTRRIIVLSMYASSVFLSIVLFILTGIYCQLTGCSITWAERNRQYAQFFPICASCLIAFLSTCWLISNFRRIESSCMREYSFLEMPCAVFSSLLAGVCAVIEIHYNFNHSYMYWSEKWALAAADAVCLVFLHAGLAFALTYVCLIWLVFGPSSSGAIWVESWSGFLGITGTYRAEILEGLTPGGGSEIRFSGLTFSISTIAGTINGPCSNL